MADHSHASTSPQHPPAPGFPPSRAGTVFQKFIAPLSFNIGAKPQGPQASQSVGVSPSTSVHRSYRNLPSQTTIYRTGIPIAAVDVNRAKTHAILAGQEILKTVHVHDGKVVEDYNLRVGINSYPSAFAARSEAASHRREYLPAKDVCWSKCDRYDNVIATAALNGRIALYDVTRLSSSRTELAWIHEHAGQVNKLDFDPTGGYLLLSGSQDKTVRVWDIREQQLPKRREIITVGRPVRDVRWSPTDAGEFALCTENGVIQRWDMRNRKDALLSINAHEKECYAIDWHPDGRHLVSGGFDKYVKVWDFKSQNRRQKPAFQIRTPAKVLNVRWRPPCWSSDLAEKGHWQSSQLATSYTEDDPRIHIWDLAQPLLPYREHDRFDTRPADLLWATEHFLWSVGSRMFVQTDVRYTPTVSDELLSSPSDFMPDGSFIAFGEDTRTRRSSVVEDATTGLLRIPQDRLSGGRDGMASRSLSDDDDADDKMLAAATLRRTSKSSRSAKSQGNTPPSGDAALHIVPLNRAVLNQSNLFICDQSGVASCIPGVAAEPDIVEFLAEHYALPTTAKERKDDPCSILDKLQDAFTNNANVCDYVSMHRMAQTWRILGAVLIPELKDWAASNRTQRLQAEANRRASAAALKQTKPSVTSLSDPKLSKAKSNMFKGVSGFDRNLSEVESTSNMTTPIAKPQTSSPLSTGRQRGHTFLCLNEAIEPITPLPPSVISAHSTAAAASNALLDTTKDESPVSSPEKPRRPASSLQSHRRALTDIPIMSLDRSAQLQSPKPQPIPKQVSTALISASPRMESRKQEDRRAAIRDFRAQQRQIFTLDEPIQSPRYSTNERHDSNESFAMFSASTDSSQRNRSFRQSFEPLRDGSQRNRDLEEWQSIRVEDATGSPVLSSTGNAIRRNDRQHDSQDSEDGSLEENFPMDETSRVDFGSGANTSSQVKPVRPKVSAAASLWDIGELRASASTSQSGTVASSPSRKPFAFEGISTAGKLNIYTSNPIRRIVTRTENEKTLVDPVETQQDPEEDEDASSEAYVYSDFRPIDFTTYEKLPFAWSALPLICHSIAFDVVEGIASAQFSVHLLMHLHPFFFNPSVEVKIQPGIAPPDNIAERLMRPDLSHRLIEGLMLNHYIYLKKIGFYKLMSELRKICFDLGLHDIFKPGESDQPVGASLKQDPFKVQTSCSHCHSFSQSNSSVCPNCGNAKASCPICLQIYENSVQLTAGNATCSSSLRTFCHTCGHSAHWSCMQQWMLLPDAEGQCPTRDCGCDCGPGLIRQQRIDRQVSETENAEIIRGGRGSTMAKKDPVKATPSPAVYEVRDNLRHNEASRDGESSRRSFSGRGSSRGVGIGANPRGSSQSLARRVRLVTPGEESGPSQSAS